MRKIVSLLVVSIFSLTLFAQTEEGIWETYDAKTGKAMSHVKVYKKDGKLYGEVVKNIAGVYTTCTKCSGADKNKPILGLMVIRGLEEKGNKWEKDDGILDPMTGYICDGELWLESQNVMKVKGSVLFFSETQTWKRVPTEKK